MTISCTNVESNSILARLLRGDPASTLALDALPESLATIARETIQNADGHGRIDAFKASAGAHGMTADEVDACLKNVWGSDPDVPAVVRPKTWADMSLEPIRFDWEDWLARGVANIIAAVSGAGKSVLMLRTAACYLRGDPWPDGKPFTGEQGAILWCEAEAAQAINLDRAKNWNLPIQNIYSPLNDPTTDVQLDDKAHRELIVTHAHRPEVKLVIVDSLRGAHRRDENDSKAVEVIMWLASLARDTSKPILIAHHLRKRTVLDGDVVTLDRLRGSSALVQPARIVWALDSPDPDDREAKRLSVIKSNLSRIPPPIGVMIDETGVSFMDAPAPPHKDTQLDKACDLLLALLAKKPLPVTDIKHEADGAAISWATIRRANDKLRIVATKDRQDGHWDWSLPVKR